MRKITLLLICLISLFAVAETHGQRKKPTMQAKKYVSVPGGFSVKFPKTPTRKTQPMNTAFGKTTLISYEASSPFALYTVMYVDFPTAIKDEGEMNIRFDAMKSSLISNPTYNLISENIVDYGEYPGREFLIEGTNHSITMRGFIIEQRLFQIVVITPGKMSRSNARLKAANQKRIDDFVNSFEVTNLPTPKTEAVELPADFGVSIEDSILTSEFFGLSYQIPEDWSVLSDEQIEMVKRIGLASVQSNNDYEDKNLEKSFQNAKFLLMATDQPIESGEGEALIMIIAEKVSFPNFLPSASTTTYIKNYLNPTEKVIKNTTMTKINGVDFAWIETFDTADKTRQRMYVANRKGIAFEVFLNYKTDAQLQVLMKSLNTLKFSGNS